MILQERCLAQLITNGGPFDMPYKDVPIMMIPACKVGFLMYGFAIAPMLRNPMANDDVPAPDPFAGDENITTLKFNKRRKA